MTMRAFQLDGALTRAWRHFARAATGAAVAGLLLSGCGGDTSDEPKATDAALPVTVSGADDASVRFRPMDAGRSSDVTVRVARDGSGAPPLDAAYTPLSEVYQFTPLGWVEAAIEVRVPFSQQASAGGSPRLLIASAGGAWAEVAGAHIDGNFMVARVPQLGYATVASRGDEGIVTRFKALAARATGATGATGVTVAPSPLLLSLDRQATRPALPAPNADGTTAVTVNTNLVLQLGYNLPTGCTVSPRVSVYAAVWNPATRKFRTVQLGQQAVAGTVGSVAYSLPLSASDNGSWLFAATAICLEPGKFWPRYASIAAGPLLAVNIGSDPVTPPPTITTAPQDVSAIEGDAVAFSVIAQGTDLVYEWQRSNDGGASYAPVAGGTAAASLAFNAALADNGALLRVRVSNANGVVTSTPARLSVAAKVIAPAITSDPANQSVLEGETASFSVAGSGTPAPTVQWQQRTAADADPQAAWIDIPAATSATYTTPATVLSQSGSQFRAVLLNSGGAARSLAATLTVQARVTAPAITANPVSQSVQAGQAGLFSVVASGTSPLSYQWFKNDLAIIGANATEVLVPADPADAGGSYQITVRVSNSAGTVTSAAAVMSITTVPTGGTLIKAATGGVVQGGTGMESDPVLEVPGGALATDTTITLITESSSVAGLPGDFVALGDVINIGPAGLAFGTPATLSLPVPEVALDGKVLAIVLLDGPVRTQRLAANRSVASGLNLARLAQSKRQASGVNILAAGDVTSVLCGRAANGVAGRFATLLSAGARLLQVAVPASACTAFAPAPPLGGIPSDTDVACSSDEEFAEVNGNTDFPEVSLVSRHVDCRSMRSSSSVLLSAALTEGPQGTFNYADPALPSNGNWSSYDIGTVQSIETRVTAFGPSNTLSKTYRVRVRALGFVPVAGYPGPVEGKNTMVVRPKPDCLAFDQLASKCSYTAPEIDVPLNGQWSEAKDVVVSLSWTQDPNRPVDAERFLIGLSQFDYKVKGASLERPPERTEPFRYFSGFGYAPELRCDRGVAQVNSSGCVFTQAAAVYVLSKAAGSDVEEAAQHIFEAQNNPDTARRSPGKWRLKAGTRAVADESVRASGALQRAKSEVVRKANRDRSCDLSTALLNTRLPLNQSAKCSAGTQACSCDEYPFASTWSGGNFDPDRTSAKRISATQNNLAGGGRLTGFYTKQRVLDFTQYPDQVQPYDPSAESNRGGDDFWVHIK